MELGWIGTGIMGRSMCGHLLAAGHPRRRVLAHAGEGRGAARARRDLGADAAAVAAASDIVFTMVGFPQDVREVYFGETGVLAGVRAGASARRHDHHRAEPGDRDRRGGRGARRLGRRRAGLRRRRRRAQRALSIMIGGEDDDVARARPLFELLGKNIVHQGGPGAGQHTKMCNQIVIAGTMIGVCESLLYGTRAGLDLETMLQSIKSGAAGCWTLENLAPRVIKRNFDPGFFVEHFIKDMGIALEEARRMKLALPGLALVHQLYVAVQAQGHGRGGTQALVLALEHMSGDRVGADFAKAVVRWRNG